MLVKFSRFAFIFVSLQVNAAVIETPVVGNEKLLISISEGNLTLVASPSAKSIRWTLSEGSENDYQLERRESVIEFRSKDQLSKGEFGNPGKKKRELEITVPMHMPVDLHLLEGTATILKMSKDLLAHVQKGKLTVRDCSGALTLNAQKGEITVADSQGRLNLDSYASAVVLKNYTGDVDLQNFSGESTVDKVKGFLSLNLGSGAARIINSSGTLQFEISKAMLSVINFGGRIEGQTIEGPVNVNLAAESDLNIKSQSGKVTVSTLAGSGALLNLATVEGDIYGPNYLKVNRDGGNKSLRGRLKGDTQKSTIVFRGQEASIIIK